jgi:hypothetical protein
MPRPAPSLPATLARAARRFEKWRRTRKKKRRIPDPLWHLATKLGGKYGVNATARALRLDYYDLKRRVEEATQSDGSGSETAPAFVELVSTPCLSAAECFVELEDPQGVKMRIHLKAAGPSELAALGHLFWRNDPCFS